MAKAKNTPPKIKIRRAIAEDAVNIFKLVKRQRTEEPSVPANNHGAIVYTLDCIERGRVTVADLSGRIVGVVGCEAPHEGPEGFIYGLTFSAVDPDFVAIGTRTALLRNLFASMKKNNHILRIVLGSTDSDMELEEAIRLTGQEPEMVSRIFELRPEPVVPQEATDPEPVEAVPEDEQKQEDEPLPEWFTEAGGAYEPPTE